jgi:hypothetical protein
MAVSPGIDAWRRRDVDPNVERDPERVKQRGAWLESSTPIGKSAAYLLCWE